MDRTNEYTWEHIVYSEWQVCSVLMQQCVCKVYICWFVGCVAGRREAAGGVGGEGPAEAQACAGPDQTGKGGAECTHTNYFGGHGQCVRAQCLLVKTSRASTVCSALS